VTAVLNPAAPPESRRRPSGVGPQLLAGLAVLSSAPALSGVLRGWLWLGTAALAVALMVLVGLLVRAGGHRAWWAAVLTQAATLLVLLTALFGKDAWLGVIPGPATLGGLFDQLGGLGQLIGSAIPPLTATGPLLLLVCLAYGVFAIVADTLTAAGHGPAACGLVLLCAFTVAATLSRAALPDWSLVTATAAFGLLLLADQRRRQRHRASGPSRIAEPGRPEEADRDRPWRARFTSGRGQALGLVVTAGAVAMALLVGVLATAVGTEGRFPGRPSDQAGADLQFGLNPFTSLRNQLSKPDPVDLLQVRGLPSGTYLRAVALSEYVPSQGWQLPDRLDDTVLDATLPTGLPSPPTAPPVTVDITNLAYRDRWLPLVGLPLGVTGTQPSRWRYNTPTATAYASSAVFEPRWVERAVVQNPQAGVLNAIGPTTDVNPMFLDTSGVDPRIGRLAASLTSRSGTPLTKAVALTQYFQDPTNGFRYSLSTPPGNSGDALVDFLTRTKIGYCEQYASAMAVMLRTVGVPARVAIGFTAGQEDAGVRVIGTRDAHAWVEAFFPGYGWLTFDPTPLGDGRTASPGYLTGARDLPGARPQTDQRKPETGEEERPDSEKEGPQQAAPSSVNPVPDAPSAAPVPQPAPGGPGASTAPPSPEGGSGAGDQPGPDEQKPEPEPAGGGGGLAWLGPAVLIGLLIGLGVVALVAAPAAVRRLLRHRRTVLAGRGGPAGAAAAWREVLADSIDRGGSPPVNRTVRAAAKNLVLGHRLDPVSAHAVRAVVDAVERGWYAPSSTSVGGPELVEALREAAAGLDRAAPLGPLDRLWPRSIRPALPVRARPADTTEEPDAGSRYVHSGSGWS
jgi:hypothetical protein